jgi:hypothetical protein
MNRCALSRLVLVALAAVAATAGTAPRAAAAEPAKAFLTGLRERGYYDVALDYLDSIAKSPLIGDEMRETIGYEKGLTILQAGRTQRDTTVRQRYFEQARVEFTGFASQNPTHPLAVSASNQVGNLLVENARSNVSKAEKMPDEKKALLAEAKTRFDEARAVFDKSLEILKRRLTDIPSDLDPKRDAQLIEQRDAMRADYVQTQLVIATIDYEQAATIKDDNAAYLKQLQRAAESYAEVADKYRTRLAGLYAVYFQAQCYQDMGKRKDALMLYDELLQQPSDAPPLRTLRTRTIGAALACWHAEKMYAPAIAQAAPWVKGAMVTEDKEQDWLELRLRLAKVYKADADSRDPKKDSRVIATSRAEANKLARFVMSKADDANLKKEATQLAAELGAPVPETAQRPDPKTFLEAREAGKEALDQAQSSALVIRILEPKLTREKDAARRKEIEEEVAKAREEIERFQRDAMHLYGLALKLAGPETSVDDVNAVRYFITYLKYTRGEYWDAVVLGEFMARKFPSSAGARQSAKIAMASYLRLYNDSNAADKSFETAGVLRVAELIANNWPNQPEADEAYRTMIPFLIQENRLDEAEAHLKKIAVDSSFRGDAELRTGQALWSTYLQGMAKLRERKLEQPPPSDEEVRQETARLEGIKGRAKKTLADGIARMQGAPAGNPIMPSAMLYLAQIYIDTDEAPKAISLLDDPKNGPLTLVKKKDPSVQREGFAEEAYKAALRAYIATLPGAADPQAVIAQAQQAMDALKTAVGSDAAGRERLIAIYVSLAGELKQMLDLAADANKKNALASGFEVFLTRVGESSTEANYLNWVAETFNALGEAYDDGKPSPPDQAKRYYQKSVATFDKMWEAQQKNSSFLTQQMSFQIRMRKAMILRRLGDYANSLDTFAAILAEKPFMVNVQVEAARTYQDRGDREEFKWYDFAIRGGRKDEKTGELLIWGWGKLARLTAAYPNYRDTFHEARYNLALCRYRMAVAQPPNQPAEKSKYLNLAKNDISATARLYPELGGAKWMPKYDALLRNVQRDLGENPVGLAAFKTAPTGPGGATPVPAPGGASGGE